MAALTQCHEVALVVRAPICKRQDVMHFLSRRQLSFALTLLTKRMRLDVACTYPSPCATVTLVSVRIALVFVVMALGDLPVLLAVPTVGQPAATRIGAGAFWFSRHLRAYFQAKEKPPQDFSLGGSRLYFLHCYFTRFTYNINSHLLSSFELDR